MVNPKSFGQFTMMHHDLPSLIFEQSLICPVVFMHQGLKLQFFVTCARRKFLLNLFSHRIWHAFSNLTRKLYRNYDQKALIRRTGLLSWVLVARILPASKISIRKCSSSQLSFGTYTLRHGDSPPRHHAKKAADI